MTTGGLQHSSATAGAAPLARPARSGRRPADVRARALKEREARPENVPGSFAVDHTCIDCDTCRWMQPEVFGRVGGMSAVVRQPEGEAERLRAAQALLACPTHSIHLTDKQKGVIREAAGSFPQACPGMEGVYHLGYHSAASFGAASYLVVRDGGNVLVDSPRFDASLLKRIQELGGVRWIFLTHKDDVADHANWAEALGAERIIHRDEVTRQQGTAACEVQLEGGGPWRLPDGGGDVQLLNTPGHTLRHLALLHTPAGSSGAFFSGDHLAFDHRGRLRVYHRYNKHSMEAQLETIARQRSLPFLHLLPGHGRPGSFASAAHREQAIHDLLVREGHVAAA